MRCGPAGRSWGTPASGGGPGSLGTVSCLVTPLLQPRGQIGQRRQSPAGLDRGRRPPGGGRACPCPEGPAGVDSGGRPRTPWGRCTPPCSLWTWRAASVWVSAGSLGVLTVSTQGSQGWRPPQCPLSLAPPSWRRLSTKTLSVSSDATPRAPSREGSPAPPRLSLPGPQVVTGVCPVTGSPPLSLAEGTLPTMPLFCFSDAS